MSVRRRPAARRLVLGLAALAAVLLLGAAGAAAVLLGTERGAAWLIRVAGPAELHVDRVRGRILGPLLLEGLRYSSADARIEVRSAEIVWRPRALLARTLSVQRLRLDDVRVTLLERAEPSPPSEAMPDVELPLRALFDAIEVDPLAIVPAGTDSAIQLGRVTARLEAAGSELLVHGLDVDGATYRAAVSGRATLRDGHPVSATFHWELTPADGPPWSGRGTVAGPLADLTLEHEVAEPLVIELSGALRGLPAALDWDARLRVPHVALATLHPDLAAYSLALDADATGDTERAGVRVRFAGTATDIGHAAGEFDVDYHDGVLRLARLDAHGVAQATAITIAGSGEAKLGDAPQAGLALVWSAALPGRPRVRASTRVDATAERVTFTGDLVAPAAGSYYARVVDPGGDMRWTATLAVPDVVLDALDPSLPAHRLAFDAAAWGDLRRVELRRLGVRLPGGGTLSGQGVLSMGPRLAWHGGIEWRDGERRAHADASLAFGGDTLRIDDLLLRAGTNRLTLNGTLTDVWDVAWELDAPELHAVVPQLAGHAASAGRLDGPLARPRVTATLDAGGLAYAQYGADTVSADLFVDLMDADTAHLRLAASGVATNGAAPVSLTLNADGLLADHRVQVSARTGDDAIELTLAGMLALPPPDATAADLEWVGAIERFAVASSRAGAWSARAPAPLRITPISALLDELCLDHAALGVCVRAAWDSAAGARAWLETGDIDFAHFADALPPDVQVDGSASFVAAAAITPAGQASGELTAIARDGSIRYRGAGHAETRSYDEARLVGVLNDVGSADAEIALTLDDGTGLRAHVQLGAGSSAAGRALTGHVSALFHDRGLLAALAPGLDETDGVLRADLTLNGTAAAPLLTGSLSVEQAQVVVPSLGIRVFDIALAGHDTGPDSWDLTGHARSGAGALELVGSARLPRPERPWSLAASVRGEDFETVHLPIARAVVSPELELSASETGVHVTGAAYIPRAAITPRDLTGAVAPSPDVVVIGTDLDEDTRSATELPLRAELRVVLGDDVHVDGLGLKGRVAGYITIIEEPEQLTTGRGELHIVDGQYSAFRQRLQIEHGRLIFTDSPVDDPALDMRVVRRTRDASAGLSIGGTLSEPDVTIFSEPDMPESEALSYLLIGRPLRGGDQQDGELLERMATSLGFAGGTALAARLGSGVGLAEARIERGERLADASLVLGTYLSPRLYVSYGFGIFDRAATVLRMRYQLSERWAVRTESGEEMGADLLWGVER